MKKIKYIISIALAGMPLLVLAQQGKDLNYLIGKVATYLDKAVALLMGFAVIMFVWYIVRYFIIDSDSKKKAEAAQYMLWSLLGFFVILSFWGLVNILINTFGLDSGSPSTWTDMRNLFPN